MQADPKVNYTHDWKLVTMFVGGNDLCGSCRVNILSFNIILKKLKAEFNILKSLKLSLTSVSSLEMISVTSEPWIQSRTYWSAVRNLTDRATGLSQNLDFKLIVPLSDLLIN